MFNHLTSLIHRILKPAQLCNENIFKSSINSHFDHIRSNQCRNFCDKTADRFCHLCRFHVSLTFLLLSIFLHLPSAQQGEDDAGLWVHTYSCHQHPAGALHHVGAYTASRETPASTHSSSSEEDVSYSSCIYFWIIWEKITQNCVFWVDVFWTFKQDK